MQMTFAQAACAVGLAGAAVSGAAQAGDLRSPLIGRWSVDQPADKYSKNGQPYRVFDVTPCGMDACAVSVGDGVCGSPLFRLFAADFGHYGILGRGRWGADVKKLVALKNANDTMQVELGDARLNPTGRVSSIPTFSANYHKTGDAQCKAGAPDV